MIGEQIITDLHRLVNLSDSLRQHGRLFRDIDQLVHLEIEVHDHRKCFNSNGSTTKKRKKYFQRQRHANNNEAIPSVLKKILRVLTLKAFCLNFQFK